MMVFVILKKGDIVRLKLVKEHKPNDNKSMYENN